MNTENSTDDLDPILLTWSHGELPPENAEQLSCQIQLDNNNPSSVEKIVMKGGKNTYVGKADQSALCNNYIVIRNRKTNTVRWLKYNNFLMSPNNLEQEKSISPAEEANKSRRDAMLDLNKEMGSKRVKRRLMEAAKISVNVGNIEKTLKTAIENEELVVEKVGKIASEAELPEYFPVCDRNASSVEQVYKVHDLISAEVLNSLDDMAFEFLKADITKLSSDERLTEFFTKAYLRMTKPDSTKIKLLLFADSLMKYLKEPARNFKLKNLVLCKYSSSLNQKLLNDFCDIGLGNIRLPTMLRAIGAVKERDSATCYKLKLPLAELPMTKGIRRSGGFGKK